MTLNDRHVMNVEVSGFILHYLFHFFLRLFFDTVVFPRVPSLLTLLQFI